MWEHFISNPTRLILVFLTQGMTKINPRTHILVHKQETYKTANTIINKSLITNSLV